MAILMFHEIERLRREAEMKESESFVCPHCHHLVNVSIEPGEIMDVTCGNCGTTVEVLLEEEEAA